MNIKAWLNAGQYPIGNDERGEPMMSLYRGNWIVVWIAVFVLFAVCCVSCCVIVS